jgi:predicted ATPase/class 3 adenylate cyclase
MSASAMPDGTVTFLFTDIEGSTRLWERYPDLMPEVIARHDRLMRQAVTEHRGVVFKMVGDAVCAAFATPVDGLAATIAAQRRLDAEVWGEVGTIRVRMALHSGAAELRDNDYFGQPLNRVARLLSTGHGGQILLSRVVAEAVQPTLPDGITLRDMGEHRLKDLQRAERIAQVVVAGLRDEFPALKSLDYRPHNLPLQPTPLIGRERELREAPVLAGDEAVRIVTFTGPGGMGKTRLAIHIAAELLDAFADGVYFISLAQVNDPELVGPAIVQTLGLREKPGQTVRDTIVDYLASKDLLLVLDNFEQVLPAAPLVADLLAACPGVKVLVTSRARLHLRGELEYAIPPLELPKPGQPVEVEHLLGCSAVRLFVDRAQSVKPDFTLTTGNAPDVVAICRRLDGWPLAIELAAARVRLLTPKAMLARLTRSLDVLSGGQRDLPDRHQTLRGTIAWSYDLLDPGGQALFRRLAVFAGGWSLEAAEAIVADGADDVLDGLMALIDHHLVQRHDVDDEPRFTMLRTIADFGLEQLDAQGEAFDLRAQHAAWFLELARSAEQSLDRRGQEQALDLLDREHDNLVAALHWYQEQEPTDGLQLGTALWRFWRTRGYLTEGRALLDALLEARSFMTPPEVQAQALSGAAMLALEQDDFHCATEYSNEALAIYEEAGSARGHAIPLLCLGSVAAKQGDFTRAAPFFERSLEVARATRDDYSGIFAIRNLAIVALVHGDVEQARAQLQESLRLARARGDQSAMASALGNLGFIALRQGQLDTARAAFEETLALARKLRDKVRTSAVLQTLGSTAADQGDTQQALSYYQECLTLCRELGNRLQAISCLEEMAYMALVLGLPEQAAWFYGATDALRVAYDAPLMALELAEREPHLAATRAALGERAFDVAWQRGMAATLDEALARGLALGHPPEVQLVPQDGLATISA